MNFLFTILILWITSYILEIAVRKQFRVPKTVLSIAPVNNVHRIGKNILLVALIILVIVSFTTSYHVLWLFLAVIFIQYIFDIIMQFKYIRQAREHVVNIFFLVFYGLAAIVILYFNPAILSF
ncbi:DUF4181 domain-containing protein [Kurthia massiliensis]|uniref:DUF4181 domain-containing protein n=1 Tax=Kurthia massiliensis TaxID=1033739 RepID=UPI000288F525|nr:DUF4181 domain-containing protein [Kurthia massiliensis]